ncbi:MAG: hypothetical protein PUI31_03210 [Clostridia bacterium]|nr:hypothetical protein [Clostridia bacterium]
MDISEIDLKNIIKTYPYCLNDTAKLRGIILDLYPNLSKGISRAILIVVQSGITSEIFENDKIDDLTRNRWILILENDWCMSGKVAEECLDLWIKAIKDVKKDKIDDKNPKFIYHKQLGYGKIQTYGELISIKFDAIPYKVYTYHNSDLHHFLRLVSENEYDSNTKPCNKESKWLPCDKDYDKYDLTQEYTDEEIKKELNRIVLVKARDIYGYNFINADDF